MADTFADRKKPMYSGLLHLHKWCRDKNIECQECGSKEQCEELFDMYFQLKPKLSDKCPLRGKVVGKPTDDKNLFKLTPEDHIC